MKKTCDNCATCPVMKIEEKLRFAYDYSFNFPMFEGCGKLFDGKTENVLCFTSFYSKTINWKAVEEAYKKNQALFDKQYENYKKQKK